MKEVVLLSKKGNVVDFDITRILQFKFMLQGSELHFLRINLLAIM